MSGARNRAEIRRLLHTYTTQLLLQTQEEAQLKINLEAEKVLCDMVLHQQYLDSMTAALAAQQQTSPPDIPALLRTVRSAGIAGCKHQQANGEQQQLPLPDSYSARLLRQASADEVSAALSRSAAEWAEVFFEIFYKFLAHLELCARSEYDYDPTSSCSIRGAPAPAGQPAQCSCQHAAAAARAAQHGTCGCAAQAQLQKTVDDTARAFLLAWVLNHTVVGASVTMRVDGTGPSEPAAPEHWEQVVDRLQLTETQELHIAICFKEFKRLMGDISTEAGCLIKCVEEPTVQLAAALRELSVAPSSEQQQQQQGAPAQSNTPSAASRQEGQEPAGWLGAGCGAWHERVALRLQEHVRRRLFVHVSVIAFVFNTLSTQQLAMMCVASFPWQASLVYLTEIISRRAQERQERQLRQQVGSRGSDASHHARSAVAGDSSDGGEHAAPAAAAAAAAGDCGGGRDSGEHEQGKLPYWRWQLQQLQEQRAAELALHQRVCWAQLGCGPANEGEQVASAGGGPSEGAAAAPCDPAQQQHQCTQHAC